MKRHRFPFYSCAAFSMVELVLAIALCAFCMLLMVGLLPVGLDSMGRSAATAAEAETLRTISSLVQQTEYSALATLQNAPLYFNAEGGRVEAEDAERKYRADITVSDAISYSANSSRALPSLLSVQVTLYLAPPELQMPRLLSQHSLQVANRGK